ncbi:MAG: hypothetical protein U1C96_11675 [Gallionella sp.]|nr:hypothetical protein [Gallionella sp.]
MAEVHEMVALVTAHVPASPQRDDLISVIRIGIKFKHQHGGKKPGALSRLVLDCARRAGPPHSFEQLIAEMELSAARRELYGECASPIEKIDRVWQLATIHLPKRGRVQVPFGTVRNHLTSAKKLLSAPFIVPPKP